MCNLLAETNAKMNWNNKASFTKRLVLWLVVVLQLCFIACLWCLQLGFNADVSNELPTAPATLATNAGGHVNFIRKAAAIKNVQRNSSTLQAQTLRGLQENVNKFDKDFYLKTNNPNRRLNETNDRKEEVWCFRNGTENEELASSSNSAVACKCQAGWHGKDCGQPEIIWRALFTAKRTFTFLTPQKRQKDAAHRLVYMIEGYFFSMDLLELQIESLRAVVDFYWIFWKRTQETPNDLKALQLKLRTALDKRNYLLFSCVDGKASNCSTEIAYKYFRKYLPPSYKLLTSDLLLYTQDRELLTPRALKFLKYYAASDMTDLLIHFRLKYVVFGFYWQHPALTKLAGVISSFTHLDSPNLGKQNPRELLHLDDDNSKNRQSVPASLTIGDLNHFGGWYCKYCQQPEEIIFELGSLHRINDVDVDVQFPNASRNHNIDVAYIQKLIAMGIDVDGKTSLTRLRHSMDKYYAPSYADENSSQYGNLLTNIYESLLYDDFEGADETY